MTIARVNRWARNGARTIGVETSRGTIPPGKAADLVVLSADAVADRRDTRDIVMVSGTVSATTLPPSVR